MTSHNELEILFGEAISDPMDELYALFSKPLSFPLGAHSAAASDLILSIGSNLTLNITQSPALLRSSLPEGTTGSVVWNITPKLASWLARKDCALRTSGLIGGGSTVLELGCGIGGVLALTLRGVVKQWICSDLGYVMKGLRVNLQENIASGHAVKKEGKKKSSSKTPKIAPTELSSQDQIGNISILELDWLLHSLAFSSPPPSSPLRSINSVIAADCIYNPALIKSFVQTCCDACVIAENSTGGQSEVDDGEVRASGRRTPCIVAQQLRSHDVFEEFLTEFQKYFDVWRIPDELIPEDLRVDEAYCVHVGLLKAKQEKTGPWRRKR